MTLVSERSEVVVAEASTLEAMEGATRYNRWVYERVQPAVGRRVLEIGCGTGTITQFLADRELVVGVDVAEEFIEASQRRFRDASNVVILHQDVITSVERLRPYQVDSAVSANVFEHIPDDLGAMSAVHSLLPRGGTFGLLVPSHPFLLGPLDGAIGHVRRYTKTDLKHKLRAAGFEVLSLRRSNVVGALGWLVTVKFLGRAQLAGGVRLYDRLVPWLARVEHRVQPPFGLSLVAIARKS